MFDSHFFFLSLHLDCFYSEYVAHLHWIPWMGLSPCERRERDMDRLVGRKQDNLCLKGLNESKKRSAPKMLFQLFTLEGADVKELVSTLQKEIDLQLILTD